MDVTGQGGDVSDPLHMRLPIQDRLIQLRDAPAQWDIESKQLSQFFRRSGGIGIAPGKEGSQLVSILSQRK